MRTKDYHRASVIVTGNSACTGLGVIGNLGRHGIPIILLGSNRRDMVRYSRYVSKRITCPHPKESEIKFINFLLDFGKQMDKKYVIIPTSDIELMALSRYKADLEQFYLLPIPPFEVIEKLVNKKKFYKLLDHMSIPYPKTYFPGDISELKSLGQEIEYPCIIKPVFSHLFLKEFGAKSFVINSSQELNQATEKLMSKDMEVMIQEIIPGKEIYMFYTYLNKRSEPIAICGYDKLRQYPPDYGSGSLCKSAWRSGPIDSAIQVLKTIEYYGMAEPEFKRDPRDGEYKLLEINARTTTESRLPAKCGVNIEYVAYLDTIGQYMGDSISPQNGILWIDEVGDFMSCLMQIKDGRLSVKEVVKSLKGKKVFAKAAWDDPIPFFVFLFNIAAVRVKRLFSRAR